MACMLYSTLHKITLTYTGYFLQDLLPIDFPDPTLSGASVIPAHKLVQLLNIGVPLGHDHHAKFHENPLLVQNLLGRTHMQTHKHVCAYKKQKFGLKYTS
jgi:hypothetical protein